MASNEAFIAEIQQEAVATRKMLERIQAPKLLIGSRMKDPCR
ncbi:MAG: hypothetical protein ACR2M8_01750 [Pyrinomonadaceae bacterium]